MNHGELHLRPKWNRKLKIMTKRASRILKLEENLEATKASQVEKTSCLYLNGNRPIQICELVLEVRE